MAFDFYKIKISKSQKMLNESWENIKICENYF